MICEIEQTSDDDTFSKTLRHWWDGQDRMDDRRNKLDQELAAAIVAAVTGKPL